MYLYAGASPIAEVDGLGLQNVPSLQAVPIPGAPMTEDWTRWVVANPGWGGYVIQHIAIYDANDHKKLIMEYLEAWKILPLGFVYPKDRHRDGTCDQFITPKNEFYYFGEAAYYPGMVLDKSWKRNNPATHPDNYLYTRPGTSLPPNYVGVPLKRTWQNPIPP